MKTNSYTTNKFYLAFYAFLVGLRLATALSLPRAYIVLVTLYIDGKVQIEGERFFIIGTLLLLPIHLLIQVLEKPATRKNRVAG